MAKRYTRLSAPTAKQDPYLTRVWRAITELQGDLPPVEDRATDLETDLAALSDTVDDITAGDTIGAWAVITASGDQAGIDESVPDLVTAFDTISDGSASHGVTVSAGVVTLPANTAGYQWEVVAELVLTHSAAGTAQFRFYQAPSGANTAVGLTGYEITASNTGHASGAVPAMAWVSGATTVGLRCTSTTSTNTVTLESEWSRIICREVKA